MLELAATNFLGTYDIRDGSALQCQKANFQSPVTRDVTEKVHNGDVQRTSAEVLGQCNAPIRSAANRVRTATLLPDFQT